MRVIDDGHSYELEQLGTDDKFLLKFVKRSGGAIQYDEEWAGLQTQEVIRALIHRTTYLDSIIECAESKDSIYHLRMALFLYEARAYRRKMEGSNRKEPKHDDITKHKSWLENPYADVPFNEYQIEDYPIGEDGHIILTEER